LIESITKWYIELSSASFHDFFIFSDGLIDPFSTFDLLKIGIELLTSSRQNIDSHISDHIHEWTRGHRLMKAKILDLFLADWFVKSLFPSIAKDVVINQRTSYITHSTTKFDLLLVWNIV